ncbi:FRG domain-containing protein [Yersinia enterocolitica]|uniref:FRG domain-containing protein n=1 Tax=Yersinia enterocolitica TaxID=630 RepID=UPI00398CFB91
MVSINSLIEFNSWTDELALKYKEVLFRGQRYPWKLLPNIVRVCKKETLLDIEIRLITAFKNEVQICLQNPTENIWDLLVVAQHHGLPTRLLDWSKEPLVALWFAIENYKEKNSKPIVWCVRPEPRDYIEQPHMERPFMGSRTKFFETNFLIPRIKAQKGCFTLFKYHESSNCGFIALEDNKTLKNRLHSCYIDISSCESLLEELEKKGISRDSIYPELDVIVKKLKREILG